MKNSLEDRETCWELLELSLRAKIGALTKALTMEIGGDRFEGHLGVEFDRTSDIGVEGGGGVWLCDGFGLVA